MQKCPGSIASLKILKWKVLGKPSASRPEVSLPFRIDCAASVTHSGLIPCKAASRLKGPLSWASRDVHNICRLCLKQNRSEQNASTITTISQEGVQQKMQPGADSWEQVCLSYVRCSAPVLPWNISVFLTLPQDSLGNSLLKACTGDYMTIGSCLLLNQI